VILSQFEDGDDRAAEKLLPIVERNPIDQLSWPKRRCWGKRERGPE
jgi:hypothetical protein